MSKPTSESKTEIIICRCGCVFAGCVVGYQDAGWIKQRAKYLNGGCTVNVIPANEVRFKVCDCDKENRPQLQLF